MNLFVAIYLGLLFVLLCPGILLRLPPGGSPITVAITHGIVFAIVAGLTCRMVLFATKNIKTGMEGFEDMDHNKKKEKFSARY